MQKNFFFLSRFSSFHKTRGKTPVFEAFETKKKKGEGEGREEKEQAENIDCEIEMGEAEHFLWLVTRHRHK